MDLKKTLGYWCNYYFHLLHHEGFLPFITHQFQVAAVSTAPQIRFTAVEKQDP